MPCSMKVDRPVVASAARFESHFLSRSQRVAGDGRTYERRSRTLSNKETPESVVGSLGQLAQTHGFALQIDSGRLSAQSTTIAFF